MSRDEERAKAEFLTEYRAICVKHGMMVIQRSTPDDNDYCPFAVGITDEAPNALEGQIQEMLIENIVWISPESYSAE